MNIGNALMTPQRSYTRQSGVASGLGQRQPQTCPTGYRWDTAQGRCIAVNMPKQGFWNQTAQGISQAGKQQMNLRKPMNQPPKPVFNPQVLPKPNMLSPYAQLIAHAVDLNPPLAQVPRPYEQQQPALDMMQGNVDQMYQQQNMDMMKRNIPQQWQPNPIENRNMVNPAPSPMPDMNPYRQQIEQQWNSQQMNMQPYRNQLDMMYQQQPNVQQQLALRPDFQRLVLGR